MKIVGDMECVDKLQAILIYNADFNFLNKKLGRNALQQVEWYNQVAQEK